MVRKGWQLAMVAVLSNLTANLNLLELTQTTDFFPFVGSIFARRAKIEPTKEEKYHAAAGYSCFCVSPKNIQKRKVPQRQFIAADPRLW
jgi:hypothetical protein